MGGKGSPCWKTIFSSPLSCYQETFFSLLFSMLVGHLISPESEGIKERESFLFIYVFVVPQNLNSGEEQFLLG